MASNSSSSLVVSDGPTKERYKEKVNVIGFDP